MPEQDPISTATKKIDSINIFDEKMDITLPPDAQPSIISLDASSYIKVGNSSSAIKITKDTITGENNTLSLTASNISLSTSNGSLIAKSPSLLSLTTSNTYGVSNISIESSKANSSSKLVTAPNVSMSFITTQKDSSIITFGHLIEDGFAAEQSGGASCYPVISLKSKISGKQKSYIYLTSDSTGQNLLNITQGNSSDTSTGNYHLTLGDNGFSVLHHNKWSIDPDDSNKSALLTIDNDVINLNEEINVHSFANFFGSTTFSSNVSFNSGAVFNGPARFIGSPVFDDSIVLKTKINNLEPSIYFSSDTFRKNREYNLGLHRATSTDNFVFSRSSDSYESGGNDSLHITLLPTDYIGHVYLIVSTCTPNESIKNLTSKLINSTNQVTFTRFMLIHGCSIDNFESLTDEQKENYKVPMSYYISTGAFIAEEKSLDITKSFVFHNAVAIKLY